MGTSREILIFLDRAEVLPVDRHFLSVQTLTSSAVTYTIVHEWTEKAKFNMIIKAADFRAAITVSCV